MASRIMMRVEAVMFSLPGVLLPGRSMTSMTAHDFAIARLASGHRPPLQYTLELEPQRELDLALAIRRFGDGSGRASVLARVGGIEHHIPRDRTVEVRVIEDVEGLCPELQIQSFLQRNPLEQRHVQVVGSDSPAELRIVRVSERRRVIVGGGAENGGADIHYLPPGVIGLETQSISGPLGQRDIRCMVAGGSHIHPGIGGAEKGVRTRS